jgi:MFS family permease
MDREPTGIRLIFADRRVMVVTGVVFVIMLGFGIVLPTLPLFAQSLGVDDAGAGLLVSSFAFTRLAFDLFAGPLVDRFGERLSATAGILVVAVSSFATGLAPTFALAVAGRAFGGGGSAVLFAALYSYLLKVVPQERMARTLGVFYGAFNVGVFAGGPIGGFIAHAISLRAPLFVYGGVLVVSAVLYLRLVPDPPARATGRARESDALRARVVGLLRQRAFVTTIVLNMALLWVIAGVYDTLVPLFAHDGLGMSEVAIGGAIGIALATEFVSLYPAGKIADRAGRKPLLLFALTALAVLIPAAGWSGSPVVLVAFLGLLGFASGSAIVPPAAMLSDVVGTDGSGTAVGIFRFAGDLGFVLGPLVSGAASQAFGYKTAFALGAVPPLVGLAFLLVTPETLRRPVSEPA